MILISSSVPKTAIGKSIKPMIARTMIKDESAVRNTRTAPRSSLTDCGFNILHSFLNNRLPVFELQNLAAAVDQL